MTVRNVVVKAVNGAMFIQGTAPIGATVRVTDVSDGNLPQFETTADANGEFSMALPNVQLGAWGELSTIQNGSQSPSVLQRFLEPHDASAPFFNSARVKIEQPDANSIRIHGLERATEPYAAVVLNVSEWPKDSGIAPLPAGAGGAEWDPADNTRYGEILGPQGGGIQQLGSLSQELLTELLLLEERNSKAQRRPDRGVWNEAVWTVDKFALRVLGRSIYGRVVTLDQKIEIKADARGQFDATIAVAAGSTTEIHVDVSSKAMRVHDRAVSERTNRDVAVYSIGERQIPFI